MSLKKHKSPIATAAGLAMLLTTFGFGALPANASTTCTVTDYSDAVVDGGSDTGSLRYCLANAQSNNYLEIVFDATSEQVISLPAKLELTGSVGNLKIDGGGNIVIERDSSVASGTKFPLLEVTAGGSDLEITGLTFRDSDNTGANGGAMVFNQTVFAKVFIYDNTFENNTADNGGAIYFLRDSGDTQLFIGKDKDNKSAGNHFENNSAATDGGAVWAEASGGQWFYENTAVSNSANRGGAIYSEGEDLVQIEESHFSQNKALTNEGGAVYATGGGDVGLIVETTSFSDNTAALHGGALSSHVPTEVQNSFFDTNRAGDYGGALNLLDESVVDYSTFIDNDSDGTDAGSQDNHGRSLYAGDPSVSIFANLFFAYSEGLGEEQVSYGSAGSVQDIGYNASSFATETQIVATTSAVGVNVLKLGRSAPLQVTDRVNVIREFSSIENVGVTVPAGFSDPNVLDPSSGTPYSFAYTDLTDENSRILSHAPGAIYYPLNAGSTSSDSDSSFSAPAPYQGPVVSGIGGSSVTTSAAPGEVISLDGSNLESVSAVTVGGLDAEVESTETGVGFVIPTGLDIGTYDLTVTSDSGTVTISGAINITVASTEGYGALKAWTKRISETEAKVYVKFPQVGNRIEITHQTGGSGEYSPVVTRTVTSTTDEFLTVNEVGTYFVRTIDLEDINRIRVIVDGEKLVQVIYK